MRSIKDSDFHMPAEWEPQSGIMLIWPHEDTDWQPYLAEITRTYLEMASAITRYEHLLIVARHPERVERLLRQHLDEQQMDRVIMRECDSNDTWARDVGPISVVSKTKPKGFFVNNHLLDFHFNGWGEKFEWQRDDVINLKLYYEGTFRGALENHSDFVLEGGAIETDGYGSLFVTTSSQLSPHRNQPLSKADIEKRFYALFDYVKRVVWIDHGHLAGDDTDGHIDTLVRCAPDHTLLYVATDDEHDEHYDDLTAMEKQLRTFRTLDGEPYRFMRLPLPDAIYDDGERLPATYANFVVLNGAVIVPTYGQPAKDEEAKRIIHAAFPKRDIIGINACTVIRQHGSLHCLTMQFPEGVLATRNEDKCMASRR